MTICLLREGDRDGHATLLALMVGNDGYKKVRVVFATEVQHMLASVEARVFAENRRPDDLRRRNNHAETFADGKESTARAEGDVDRNDLALAKLPLGIAAQDGQPVARPSHIQLPAGNTEIATGDHIVRDTDRPVESNRPPLPVAFVDKYAKDHVVGASRAAAFRARLDPEA